MDMLRFLPIFEVLICLSSLDIAASATAGNESVTYFFDPRNNAAGVRLGDTCYATQITADVSATLYKPYILKNFELHMLEVVTMHYGQHTKLTSSQLAAISGNIAQGCASAVEIYRIFDKFHKLLIPQVTTPGPTVPSFYPIDCHDLLHHGARTSGVYRVYPHGVPHGANVYCDMDTDGGGWLVFQRRVDATTSFDQDWYNYTIGFGDFGTNFWLGNHLLHSIVSQREYVLRIDLERDVNTRRFAVYDRFFIEDEEAKYRLIVSGYYGDAGDQLTPKHEHMKFTTFDQDNDILSNVNCAVQEGGGWWFKDCISANLNGPYRGAADGNGIFWSNLAARLTKADMKIRPILN